jgi:hypothetical protein
MTSNTGGGMKGRDASGQYVRTVEAAERDAEAARLKAARWSYTRIAEHYKVNKRSAIEMVKRGLAQAGQVEATEARAEMVTQLDQLIGEALTVLQRRHVVVSHGRVILDPETREPMLDDAPVLAAIDRVNRLLERKARLLGADAPVKSEVTVTDDGTSVAGEVAAFLAGLDAAARERVGGEGGVEATGSS